MKFEKVSKEQFLKDFNHLVLPALPEYVYENIKLPQRATSGSAGYDFFMPYNLILRPGAMVRVETGIRINLDKDKSLKLYPRSGLGIKGLNIVNQVGLIDSDYYFAPNEGHIIVYITNICSEPIELLAGKAFVQGEISQYFVVDNDICYKQSRNGGFGSTSEEPVLNCFNNVDLPPACVFCTEANFFEDRDDCRCNLGFHEPYTSKNKDLSCFMPRQLLLIPGGESISADLDYLRFNNYLYPSFVAPGIYECRSMGNQLRDVYALNSDNVSRIHAELNHINDIIDHKKPSGDELLTLIEKQNKYTTCLDSISLIGWVDTPSA